MRKKNCEKAPSAPKRPLNAFMEFTRVERKKILDESGLMSTKEISKEIGRRWKNLTETEKLLYEEKQKENKKLYLLEKRAFKGTQNRTKKKDPSEPKKPLSSFMEFSLKERHKVIVELGNVSIAEIGKEIGKRWSDLPVEEKEVFKVKAKENIVQYEIALEGWRKRKKMESDARLLTSSDVEAEVEVELVEEDSCDEEILLPDVGFAKQRGFHWHPALKVNTLANGSRVQVRFFGSGQTCIVNKSGWINYSEQSANRIGTNKLSKTVVTIDSPVKVARGQPAKLVPFVKHDNYIKDYNVTWYKMTTYCKCETITILVLH